MKSSPYFLAFIGLLAVNLLCFVASEDSPAGKDTEAREVDEEKLEYAKGSLCGYCDYCKFCKLCDEDCPCETSETKPNCEMCKYCKYCYLCKACDTLCQPGGVIDTVTAAFVNALPSFNRDEVDSDIDRMSDWIEKKKDEL